MDPAPTPTEEKPVPAESPEGIEAGPPQSSEADLSGEETPVIPLETPPPPEILSPTEPQPTIPEIPTEEPNPEPTVPSTNTPTIETPPAQPSLKSFLGKALQSIQFRKKAKLEKIMKLAHEKRSITNDQVEKLLRVSDATATRYLSALVRQGHLKRLGISSSTRYEPTLGSIPTV